MNFQSYCLFLYIIEPLIKTFLIIILTIYTDLFLGVFLLTYNLEFWDAARLVPAVLVAVRPEPGAEASQPVG